MSLQTVARDSKHETLNHTWTPILGKPVLTTSRGMLFRTDCMKLFPLMKDGVIDCVFADPPFNLGKVYGNGEVNDALRDEEYLEWCYSWLDECAKKLKDGGALFVYSLPRWGFHFASHLEAKGLLFRHWIAVSMKGSFPRGNKLYPAHYGLLYFTKGKPRVFHGIRIPIPLCRHCGEEIKDYGGHRKYLNPRGLNLSDIWDDTSPARHRKEKSRWHVNELKPMIPWRCIRMATNWRNIVLDPFGGGGSTYVEAERLKRYWIGTEITDCTPIINRFRDNFHNEIGKSPPAKILSVFK